MVIQAVLYGVVFGIGFMGLGISPAQGFGGVRETVEEVIQVGQEMGQFYHGLTNFDYQYGGASIHINYSVGMNSCSAGIKITFKRPRGKIIKKASKSGKILSVTEVSAHEIQFDSLEAVLAHPQVSAKAKEYIRREGLTKLKALQGSMGNVSKELVAMSKVSKTSESTLRAECRCKGEQSIKSQMSGIPGVKIE